MTLYETALKLAVSAHEGQKRKHDGSAYINHPIMVARILEQAGFSETIVSAGLVHDVLEDTTISEVEIRTLLGDAVADVVLAVSENKDLEWEERKEKYVETVIAGGEAAWALSVADKIHNAKDFFAFHEMVGPKAWAVFNRGKDKKMWFEHLVYNNLSQVWKHPLLDEYGTCIARLETLEE